MFLHTTVDIEVCFGALREALGEAPAWLASLVPDAVREAVAQIGARDAAIWDRVPPGSIDEFTVTADVGRPHVSERSASVPLTWRSRLDPAVFPSLLPLRVLGTPRGERTSRLSLAAHTGTRRIEPALLRDAVAIACDAYLLSVGSRLAQRAGDDH